MRTLERREREVSERVIMRKIFLERMREFFRRAIFEANAIVDAGVVDERVDFSEVLRRRLNRALTLGCVGEFALKRAVTMTRSSEFLFHLAEGSAVAIEHDGYS